MRKKVALFVGSDITAHLIMNQVVEDMIDKGVFEPVLFFPDQPKSTRGTLPELRNFAFHDRVLLNDFVYPHIEQNPFPRATNLSPAQLALAHNLQCEAVPNVNSPEFCKRIADDKDIVGGISIRCFQIFKEGMIDTFKEKNAFFLNLHPGLLPEYRGVFSTFRRMFDIAAGNADANDYGCTLHKIDRGIDTGYILQTLSREYDAGDSGFLSNVKMAPLGANLINNALNQVHAGFNLRGYPQDATKGQYYTYPTIDEVCDWNDAGVKFIKPGESVSTLVNAFSRAGTPHGQILADKLTTAIKNFENSSVANIARFCPSPVTPRSAGKNDDGPKAAIA